MSVFQVWTNLEIFTSTHRSQPEKPYGNLSDSRWQASVSGRHPFRLDELDPVCWGIHVFVLLFPVSRAHLSPLPTRRALPVSSRVHVESPLGHSRVERVVRCLRRAGLLFPKEAPHHCLIEREFWPTGIVVRDPRLILRDQR